MSRVKRVTGGSTRSRGPLADYLLPRLEQFQVQARSFPFIGGVFSDASMTFDRDIFDHAVASLKTMNEHLYASEATVRHIKDALSNVNRRAWEGDGLLAQLQVTGAYDRLVLTQEGITSLINQVIDRLPSVERLCVAPPIHITPVFTTHAIDVPTGISYKAGKAIPDDGLYYRLGFDASGNPRSDCTWYAAAAVKQASGGRIDLNSSTRFGESLGNATKWADNAEAYAHDHPNGPISGVDHVPHTGDVMWFASGHVAFVESATLSSDGKNWILQISEEDASGQGFKHSTQVDVGDGVLRWTRALTVPVAGNEATKFIHFRY
jgi:hypothetical protein